MINKPDLAFFFRSLGGGGAERITANLVKGFSDRGYKVDLVLTHASGSYLKELPSRVRVINLGEKTDQKIKSKRLSHSALKNLFKLVDYLNHNQPRILITGTHFINEVGILAKILSLFSVKVCVIEHTTISSESRFVEQRSSRILPWTIRLLYPWADYIVAVSQGVAKDLAEIGKLRLDKITPIYNPILTQNIDHLVQKNINHPWLQDQNYPIILGAGRFVAQKDFETLVHAFAQVRSQMQSRLVLIGGGLQKRRLQQLSQYLNIEKDVLLLDFVDNPYAWLAHASVFVLSSRWEGLPTVLVEALALEIPVVSTDCPSGPREILEGGKYGSLVPVGDISGMSEAIIEILQGRVRFSPVSESWRDQFSLTTAIDRYEKLLNLSYCLPNQNESNI